MNTKILTGMTGSSLRTKTSIILLMITKSKSLILSFQVLYFILGYD